jgi:hypothetical protein
MVEKSYADSLSKELENERAKSYRLEASIKAVRNAIALGTWNINPEHARFSVEVGKLFEAQLKEGELCDSRNTT